MEKRIDYIDTIKGIAIILMVVGHTIAWNYEDWTKVVTITPPNIEVSLIKGNLIWQLIYSFHMSLFFLISGFLTYKENCQLNKVLLAKCNRLLIPYLCTGFFLIPLRGIFGYWFLFSLFLLSVIGVCYYKIADKLNLNKYLQLIILIIFSLCMKKAMQNQLLVNPIADFGQASSYVMPFLLGMYFRKFRSIYENLTDKYLTLYFFVFIILFNWRYTCLFGMPDLIYHIGSTLSFYILPIVGSLIVISIIKHTNRTFSMLNLLGKKTLDVYIFHVFFIIQIKEVGEFWLRTNACTAITTQILYSVIVSGVSITISLCIAWVIQKSPVLNKLLFGNKTCI